MLLSSSFCLSRDRHRQYHSLLSSSFSSSCFISSSSCPPHPSSLLLLVPFIFLLLLLQRKEQSVNRKRREQIQSLPEFNTFNPYIRKDQVQSLIPSKKEKEREERERRERERERERRGTSYWHGTIGCLVYMQQGGQSRSAPFFPVTHTPIAAFVF